MASGSENNSYSLDHNLIYSKGTQQVTATTTVNGLGCNSSSNCVCLHSKEKPTPGPCQPTWSRAEGLFHCCHSFRAWAGGCTLGPSHPAGKSAFVLRLCVISKTLLFLWSTVLHHGDFFLNKQPSEHKRSLSVKGEKLPLCITYKPWPKTDSVGLGSMGFC